MKAVDEGVIREESDHRTILGNFATRQSLLVTSFLIYQIWKLNISTE